MLNRTLQRAGSIDWVVSVISYQLDCVVSQIQMNPLLLQSDFHPLELKCYNSRKLGAIQSIKDDRFINPV